LEYLLYILNSSERKRSEVREMAIKESNKSYGKGKWRKKERRSRHEN
jgi:hypothetical protein